jgi:hypothetical protein
MKARGQSKAFEIRNAAGARTDSWQTPVGSFKIAGVAVRAPDLQPGSLSFIGPRAGKSRGVLEMDILGQNWSVIDFGDHKLYIAEAH